MNTTEILLISILIVNVLQLYVVSEPAKRFIRDTKLRISRR